MFRRALTTALSLLPLATPLWADPAPMQIKVMSFNIW